MKLTWLGYLVYSLGNYAIKLCIKTDLITYEIITYVPMSLSICTYLIDG
jgi:hypothetical protein